MAGSLNHIIGADGRFTMDSIENLGDAYEALEECFNLIYTLSGGDQRTVSRTCLALGFPDPWEDPFNDNHKEPMRIDEL